MTQKVRGLVHTQASKTTFALSIVASVFILAVSTINVYEYAIVGAIFELLWLPILIGLVLLPIISIVFLIREGFSLKSLYFYSILVIGFAILTFWIIKT
ncbi:MAG: hypothetical protein EOO02_23515 [Chitinophagaceae bacterium]|nr:MAG: hypothetical protein EOO02_23515 [Chitinophagaceae bacterium]